MAKKAKEELKEQLASKTKEEAKPVISPNISTAFKNKIFKYKDGSSTTVVYEPNESNYIIVTIE